MQRESPMKQQAVRIVSTHQEEFLWQSTATWEQWLEQKKGAFVSIPGSEGRLTQVCVNVRGGLRVFSVYFWHSEGWAPRNEALLEAVLKQARTTRHPWLIACDANTCPEDFVKGLWFQREHMHVVAPKKASTSRSKGPKVSGSKEPMITSVRVAVSKEKYCRWWWWKILSQDHMKQCPLWLNEKKEIQERSEHKLPKVLPGCCGGRLPARTTKEKGREEREVDENSGERRIRSQIAQKLHDCVKEAYKDQLGKVLCEAGSVHKSKESG